MRTLATGLALLLIAGSAGADVRLMTRKDGSKVICNTGVASGRAGNLDWLAKQRNRHTPYDGIIDRHAAQYGVDPVLVRAVIQVESDFNPGCVSRKGARGLMQLMPDTARRYGVARVHDPEDNVRGGVRYLRDLLSMFPNDLPRTLAAYNAGENAVARYGGVPPYTETMTYVTRALTVYYGRPYGEATTFSGRSGGSRLRGGFGNAVTRPLATAILPGMRYLGTR